MLERLTGARVAVRRVPVALMTAIVAVLRRWAACRRAWPKRPNWRASALLRDRIHAVLGPKARRYDAAATPEFGADRLEDHYAALLRGEVADDRGAHAVF